MDTFVCEFVKPFEISINLLGKSEIDIYKKKTTLLSKFFRLPFILTYGLFYVSLLIHTKNINSGDIEFIELAYLIPVLVVATQSILKGTVVLLKKDKIKDMIHQLGTSWRMDNLTIVQIKKKEYSLKQLHYFHTSFYWINIIGSYQYMMVPFFETVVRALVLQQETDLQLPFFCSLPFDPTTSWIRYVAVYIFEVYSMVHLVYIYLGAEFLMITLCGQLTTEFSLLQEDLRHVKPSSRRNSLCDVTKYNSVGVKDIIKRHQRLIMLSNQLNDIFNEMIFINLLLATITICFFGFVATKARGPADMVNNFVGLMASIVPIFNICYYGELLTEASAGVADAAYHNLWYHGGSVDFQKILIFIILRSQRPCYLTSLKYTSVSLNTFATVMSTTWSYFSLATKLYDQEEK